MNSIKKYSLNKNLGGVISFGSYFYLSILILLMIISAINSRYFFVILFGFVGLISFYLFFMKKLRYRDVSFDREFLYVGSSEKKIDIKNIISITKGSIRYRLKNGKIKTIKFFYTPNNNYNLLKKFKEDIG